jgi:hypothetical protein
MRRSPRPLLVALFGTLLSAAIPVGTGDAQPRAPLRCSCIASVELIPARDHADALFLGRVTSKEEVAADGASTDFGVRFEQNVTMEVLAHWKGELAASVQVLTGVSDADCGFPFRVGETYLVFANSDANEVAGRFATSICSRTAATEYATEDLIALGVPLPSSSLGP